MINILLIIIAITNIITSNTFVINNDFQNRTLISNYDYSTGINKDVL